MTIKEAFIAELDEVSVSDITIEKTLIDRGVVALDAYAGTESQKRDINLCMIDVLFRLFTRPDIAEGEYQKNHPDFLRKIEARLMYLAEKHQVSEVLAVIKKAPAKLSNITNLW